MLYYCGIQYHMYKNMHNHHLHLLKFKIRLIVYCAKQQAFQLRSLSPKFHQVHFSAPKLMAVGNCSVEGWTALGSLGEMQ